MRLSVCVEMLFTELPFVERIAAIAAAGYSVYEFWAGGRRTWPRTAHLLDGTAG